MSRSLSYLRRGLLGAAFVGSLGFGFTQAIAAPASSKANWCTQSERAACQFTCESTYGPGIVSRCYKLGSRYNCVCQAV